jgi:hypothetical protein
LFTVIGIQNCHPYAIAEFVWFVSECRMVCHFDGYEHPAPMRWVGQSALLRALEQPFYEEQGPKDASSIPGRQNRAEQFGTYIVLHIPSRAQDPDSRSNLAESTALNIINELFELGRGLRNGRPMSREKVRAYVYDWMTGNGGVVGASTSQVMAAQSLSGQRYRSYAVYMASQPAISTRKRRRAIGDD